MDYLGVAVLGVAAIGVALVGILVLADAVLHPQTAHSTQHCVHAHRAARSELAARTQRLIQPSIG